jgi:hypothetical protein
MTLLQTLSGAPIGFTGDDPVSSEIFFDARATLLSQYANSPVITALISSLNYALDLQVAVDAFYSTIWNIDTASGFGLDIWGRILGVSRALYLPNVPFLGFAGASGAFSFGAGSFWGGGNLTPNYDMTDDTFRRVLLAKAALNITDASIPAINTILMALFPSYGNVYVQDNANMTMAYVFPSAPSNIDYAIVTQSGVLPKPIGVSFTVVS